MSEYMAESPLWSTDDMLLPEELRLSPNLVTALNEWQSHFEAHFHHETGWDSATSREWYRVRAPGLVDALNKELPAGSQVDVNLWPLTGEN
jgi:hypothetical protein